MTDPAQIDAARATVAATVDGLDLLINNAGVDGGASDDGFGDVTFERMEAAANGFQARVAAAYERLAQRHPARIKRLDATRPPEALHKAIWRDVCALLAR